MTARYVTENVQQTPISITALNGDQLEQRGFNNITDVAQAAPNVTLSANSGAFGKSAAAFIRGVGQNDYNYAFDPGVGFYIDDVYFGTVYGNEFDLTDIDRVEIERGPQGTLFGKNSEGGAIRIFTPEAKGDNSGYVEAGYGSYNEERFRGAFDIAVVPDQLFLRIAAGSVQRDGYMDILDFACANPKEAGALKPMTTTPGCKLGTLGGEDARTARADIRWLPSDTLQVKIDASLYDDHGEAPANKTLIYNPTYPGSGNALLNYSNNVLAPLGFPGVNSKFLTSSPFTTYGSFSDPVNGYNLSTEDPDFSYTFSGTIDYDTPWGVHLKNIAAYQKYDAQFNYDLGGTPYFLSSSDQYQDHHQFSEELQASGKLFDGQLEWVVGGYFYTAQSEASGPVLINAVQIIPPGGAPFAPGGVYGLDFSDNDPVIDHDKSGFVHFLYHATDELSVEAGARYTYEDKTYTFSRILLPVTAEDILFDNPIFNPNYPYIPGFQNSPSATSSTRRVDPRIAFNYQWTPEFMTYFSVATGFKGGGINPRPVTIDQVVPFKAEDLTAYEVGEKSQFLDNKLRLDADIFVSNYKNLQIGVLPPGSTAVLTQNAGHVLIDGFEGTIDAEPIPGLLFNGDVSYLNYQTLTLGEAAYSALNLGGILPGTKPAYIPKWKYDLGVQYSMDFGDFGTVTPRLDWTFQSSIVFQNNPVGQPPAAMQPGYGLLNGHLTYDSPDGDWEAVFQCLNMTDKLYYVNMFNELPQFGFLDATPGLPRTYLFTIKRSFQPQHEAAAYNPPAPPPPAPAPAPAAAPEVEKQREFQVFFDFDKSNITEAAANVIQAAAGVVRSGGIAHITVTGHTDTVGTAKYNQALSERRAASVKTQLVTDGVAGGEITTVGVGKTGLLVPTADGVREPQNRRAVIDLQ